MKLSEVLTPSFRQLGRELDLKVEMFEGRLVVIAPMWRKALSTESQFCQAVVAAGYLTVEQMLRAARRYRLGSTLQGGVIFWQIDGQGDIYDGKVMYYRPDCHRDKQRHPTWVSAMLTQRCHWPDADRMTTRHCLFGLHLLNEVTPAEDEVTRKAQKTQKSCASTHGEENFSDFRDFRVTYPPAEDEVTRKAQKTQKSYASTHREENFCDFRDFRVKNQPKDFCVTYPPVCVVESEKSAVILSEYFPQHIWMASGGMGNVQPDKFRPLRGRRVMLFPDTDPDGKTYQRWHEAALLVMQQPFWEHSPPITVSSLLERRATPEQKRRKIDLVDFLFEASNPTVWSLQTPRIQR